MKPATTAENGPAPESMSMAGSKVTRPHSARAFTSREVHMASRAGLCQAFASREMVLCGN